MVLFDCMHPGVHWVGSYSRTVRIPVSPHCPVSDKSRPFLRFVSRSLCRLWEARWTAFPTADSGECILQYPVPVPGLSGTMHRVSRGAVPAATGTG